MLQVQLLKEKKKNYSNPFQSSWRRKKNLSLSLSLSHTHTHTHYLHIGYLSKMHKKLLINIALEKNRGSPINDSSSSLVKYQLKRQKVRTPSSTALGELALDISKYVC